MKRLLILLVVTLSIVACNKSAIDTGGVETIVAGTNSRLNKIIKTNDGNLIVAGGDRFFSAEILVSQDGGRSFSLSTHPEAGKSLYGSALGTDNTTYVCGYDGKLLVSKDNGASWNFHQLQYWWHYVSMAVTSNKQCLLLSTNAQIYGTLLRVDSNYNVADTVNFKFGLNKIAMPSVNTGYIAAYGAVLKTTDGGYNWDYLDIKNDNFTGLYCLGENDVWAVGYAGSIWHTTDGGANWERFRNGNNILKKGYSFLNVKFRDNNTGWICGEKGLLLQTTDGGTTWMEYDSFTEEALRDIEYIDDHLIVVGDNGSIFRVPVVF